MIINSYFLHIKEEQTISDFINTMPFKKVQFSEEREYFFAISDFVDKNFNKDIKTWKYTNLQNRPFLRQSASELLKTREGVCGEGTRVMIKILHSLGYDATRLAFYSKKFGAAHALVSVEVDGKEIIVDSINYPKELNKIIRNKNSSMSEIDLIYYGQRFIKKEQSEKTEFAIFFENNYATYSYEAIPYSKLISAFGMNMHIFNYDRPFSSLSYLAESVYLIKTFLWTLLLLLWIGVYFAVSFALRKFDKCVE